MAFLDSFTGTAGTKLDTRTGWAKIGIGWSPQIPEINASNQVKSASSTDDVPLVGQNTGNANHYVQAKVLSGFQHAGGAAYSMLNVRATGRNDAYGVAFNGGSWILYKDNGSAQVSTPGTFVAGALLRIEAEGAQIRVYVNGTKIIDFTDSEKTANTNVGLIAAGVAGNDPVFDDYESGLIAAAPAATGALNTRTIDAQSVTYTFTTANTPTSGTMTLTATGGGAVTQGPNNLTLGTNTASITFTGVAPGTYSESGAVSGAGGGGAITGLSTLSIASVSGNPVDTGEPTVPTATVTSVTVSPTTATGSTTFTATVNGTNGPSQAVTWSATGGTITGGGVFTAPSAINSDQYITVKATSDFDPTKYGTALVTIAAVPNAVPPSFSSVKKGRSRRKGRR